MLLHKSFINVAIANILNGQLNFYDPLGPNTSSPKMLCSENLRANYITLTWKRLIESLDPTLPNLTENGWGSDFVSLMTDELPAPAFSLELTICRTKKTHCANNQCLYHKNQLQCSEACHCVTYENEVLCFEELGFEV